MVLVTSLLLQQSTMIKAAYKRVYWGLKASEGESIATMVGNMVAGRHTSSMATPPDPSQIVLLTEDQAVKYWAYGGHSHPNHHKYTDTTEYYTMV